MVMTCMNINVGAVKTEFAYAANAMEVYVQEEILRFRYTRSLSIACICKWKRGASLTYQSMILSRLTTNVDRFGEMRNACGARLGVQESSACVESSRRPFLPDVLGKQARG
jgi:hypothetical protein